jgi:hypothetical protein
VKQRVLTILWPAFAMAGVLEMLVFSQVDPAELHGLGASGAAWSPQAVYTLAFLAFWAVISVASGVTLWLAGPPPDENDGARP